jgi:hypothetical protein
LLAATASAQSKGQSWLRGAWEGTGYQTDDASSWPMKVTIAKRKNGRRVISIEYPSLNCGGRWKLLSVNGSKANLRERLDHGQDQCTNNGRVTLERIGRQLIFLYSLQGSREITASAVLNRPKPPPTP